MRERRGSRSEKIEPREFKLKGTRVNLQAHGRVSTPLWGLRSVIFYLSSLSLSLSLSSSSFSRSLAPRVADSPKDGPSSLQLSDRLSARRADTHAGTQDCRQRRAARNMKTPMENQLSWLALFMTALYSLLASCRGEECGHEELVRCARPLEKISNNDLSFATKKEDINKLCPDLEAGMKCIKRYTINCMKEPQREHFNSLYSGTNMAIMELCQDGPYQDEFLKHAPCMQKSKAEYEMCYKSYQKTTQEMAANGSLGRQNLKSLCCAFKEYLECSHHTVRRQCGVDTARFAKEFLDRMSSSLLKEHCSNYTDCNVHSGTSTLNLSAIMPMTLILLMRYFT